MGPSRFTFHPKEGVLRIFIALKNPSPWPGSNSRTLGLVAITLTTTPPRRLLLHYKHFNYCKQFGFNNSRTSRLCGSRPSYTQHIYWYYYIILILVYHSVQYSTQHIYWYYYIILILVYHSVQYSTQHIYWYYYIILISVYHSVQYSTQHIYWYYYITLILVYHSASTCFELSGSSSGTY
jgi:hypothetical protein